jgi:hypothetical protein
MGEAPELQGEPTQLQFEPPWPQDVSSQGEPALEGEPLQSVSLHGYSGELPRLHRLTS